MLVFDISLKLKRLYRSDRTNEITNVYITFRTTDIAAKVLPIW